MFSLGLGSYGGGYSYGAGQQVGGFSGNLLLTMKK